MTPDKDTIQAVIEAAEKSLDTADKNCGWEVPIIRADIFIQELKKYL